MARTHAHTKNKQTNTHRGLLTGGHHVADRNAEALDHGEEEAAEGRTDEGVFVAG